MAHIPVRTVIYGAGSAGRSARQALAADARRTLVAFADGDPRKGGTSIAGLPVVPPGELAGSWYDEIVIASQAWREITSSLLERGIGRERLAVFHCGDARVEPLAPQPASSPAMPSVLVLTDDCVSPGHGTGAVLLRHFARYPADRLAHAYLRRKGDPFWPNSHALAVDGRGEAGSITPDALVARLAASGQLPDVIYANVFGEPGLDALVALARALGGRVPIIQHFQDVLYADQEAFDRTLVATAPLVTEFWAITDALARYISDRVHRPVTTMNPFKCEIAPAFKRDHRDLDARFRVVMLGNSHMPWVLHHVRNVWRTIRNEVPGLEPIRWFGYPTSALYVRDAGVEFEPDIEYYGYLNDRRLHEQLCEADLALVPFNIADIPEYHYAEHSVPSRITEFLNAGLPIFAAAGRHTETFRFLTARGIGICATLADEAGFTRALLDVMRDTPARMALARRARAFAEEHCDVRRYQATLTDAFVRVAATRPSSRPRSDINCPRAGDEELEHA